MTKRRIFHKLLPIEKAIDIIEQVVDLRPRGVESVDLLSALGRILAIDVYATMDYPPFDRSDVDGYAVRAEDTYGASEYNPVKLRILESVGVGETPRVELDRGGCIEIATGAPIPRGCNAIVMEEYTHRADGYVEIYRAVAPLENVTVSGSDIAYGELVLPKGTKLGPFELGVLAALGYSSIEVYLKPKVAVISTGSEIVQPGTKLEYGRIYDYNGFALTAYLRSIGAEASYLGVVPDNKEELKNVILSIIDKYDAVVTSGGTSAGVGDVVYKVVDELGETLVHGLEVKPGKPTVVGVIKKKIVIGLPGFPFSATSNAVILLRYVIEKLCGIETPVIWHSIRARITQKMRKEVGKDLYVPVVLTYRGTELIAIPIPFRSGNISLMLKASAIAVIRKGVELVNEGTEIDVIPLNPEIPEAIFIGSHDMLLSLLLKVARISHRCRFIPVGSLVGLVSVSKGYGDVAPIHLLDPDSVVYNKPYVKQFNDLVLVSGYKRKLVLAFKQGNPKNIRGLEDVLRKDIMFVNRNRGSGTRAYIDMMLSKLAKELNTRLEDLIQEINGYTYEVSSHTGVAAAIAQGRADLGVCIEYAARIYNLDYIPLAWEEYDFAVNRHSLESKPTIRTFVEFLRSDTFRKIVNGHLGYAAKEDSGTVYD